MFELVKNAYDANATKVDVEFWDVLRKESPPKIIIADNGIGMSFSDVRDKWMVVGTNNKRQNRTSPHPFNRRVVGEKGIGRFAVDKLGANLLIRTKQLGSDQWLNVRINWETYEHQAKDSQLNLFTDIENPYYFEEGKKEEHGTSLEISVIKELWTKSDIDRVYKELSKIVSPFYPINPPFDIRVRSNEHLQFADRIVNADAIKFASHHAELSFDENERKQEILRFNRVTGRLYTQKVDYKSFGPIKMKLYYFDQDAKIRYNRQYRDSESRIDGIKIYRDGVVTTPFAEFEANRDKQRDILGIDKRLWRDIFNRIGTREVIGVVEISKDLNGDIIDATNRQDFVDNQQYRDLKDFIISQLDVFSEIKIWERSQRKISTVSALEKAGNEVTIFAEALKTIEENNPNLRPVLSDISRKAQEVEKSISKGITEQKQERKEFTRKENIYLSLMSLQDYAVRISHSVRTSLGKIKRMAEFFKRNFPNAQYDGLFKEYAALIFEEMNTLNKVIDFMLSYAGSNVDFEEFSVKSLIENLLFVSYKQTFIDENISVIVEIRDEFVIDANRKFFQDIIQNLVSNSIKALQGSPDKMIKCTGYIENNSFVFLFSDNGYGIKMEDKERIFDIYYTTTAEEGGAGLGLFIVKTRIEALRGTIEVIESEYEPSGATFKITFPFKKQDTENE